MTDFKDYKTMWPEEFLKLKTIKIPKDVKIDDDEIDSKCYAILDCGFCEFLKFKDQKFIWYYKALSEIETEAALLKIRAFCGKKNGKLMVRYLKLNALGMLRLFNLKKK